ncbi:hypothetical protein FACS189485_02590 [Spirochaetia bacterium]|nr:hypothetical protein FACS189485_02590 [Spirochaetia bacterium]
MENNSEADALKESGKKYIETDEYDKAIAELGKALQIAPNDAELHKRCGDVHKDKVMSIDGSSEGAVEIIRSECTLAVEDYSAAIKLNPEDAESYNERGLMYHILGDDQKALVDFNQAISINPDMSSAYYRRDDIYSKQKKLEVEALKESAENYSGESEYDKAIGELTRAIQITPDDAELYKRRGDVHKDIVFQSDGEIEKAECRLAVEDYSAAIKLNPNDTEAYRERGWIYYFMGDDQKALADYNHLISINPDMISAYRWRGEIYSRQNKLQAAMDDFDKAISLDKEGSLAYWGRGEVYEKKGDLDNAFADFREAARLDDDFWAYDLKLGDKYKEREEYQKAIEAYSEGIKKDPTLYHAYIDRAGAYGKLDNNEAAIADLTKTIQILTEKEDSWVYNPYALRGKLYYNTGKYTSAVEDLSSAIELYNKKAEINNELLAKMHYYRSLAYQGLDDKTRAETDSETAFRLYPELGYLYFHFDQAVTYEEQGNHEAATREYQTIIAECTKVIELDSSSYYSYYNRAHAYDNLENYEAAIADLTTMIQILSGRKKEEGDDIAYAYAYSARGEVCYEEGKYANALKDYNDAIDWSNKCTEIDNNWLAETYNERALTYKALGDKTRANADFEMAVKLDPKNVEYRKELENGKQKA